MAWAMLLASTAAFVALQVSLGGWENAIAEQRGFLGMATAGSQCTSAATFLALSSGGLLAVWAGRRRASVVPALLWTFLPVVMAVPIGRVPAPIGVGWMVTPGEYGPPLTPLLWVGALVDLALVCAPALVLAWPRSTSANAGHDRRARRGLRPIQAASIVLAAFGVLLLAEVLAATTQVGDASVRQQLVLLGPCFALGAVVGIRRPWWPWATLLLGAGLATGALGSIFEAPHVPHGYEVAMLWPPVLAAFLGSLWPALTWGFERLRTNRVGLIVAVNALNVADALLTAFAVRSGEAVESNPVVRLIGLPAKIMVVALLSVVVARWRPRLLIWPVVALVAVLGWHLAGLALRP
jgi:hypothetical protein